MEGKYVHSLTLLHNCRKEHLYMVTLHISDKRRLLLMYRFSFKHKRSTSVLKQ